MATLNPGFIDLGPKENTGRFRTGRVCRCAHARLINAPLPHLVTPREVAQMKNQCSYAGERKSPGRKLGDTHSFNW